MYPKEVLKNQINFNSDLIEIKRGNPQFKSEEYISVIQDVDNYFFNLTEKKIITFFRDYSFLLSEA